jgi:hypothetical protein
MFHFQYKLKLWDIIYFSTSSLSVFCICSCCNIIIHKKLGIIVQQTPDIPRCCLDHSTEYKPHVKLQQHAGHRQFVFNYLWTVPVTHDRNFLHTNGQLMCHDSSFKNIWHICNEKAANIRVITLPSRFLTACNNFKSTEFHGILQTFRHTRVSVKIGQK